MPIGGRIFLAVTTVTLSLRNFAKSSRVKDSISYADVIFGRVNVSNSHHRAGRDLVPFVQTS